MKNGILSFSYHDRLSLDQGKGTEVTGQCGQTKSFQMGDSCAACSSCVYW